MIQRNVQELNSFIRIDKLSDLTNKNFNLEVGNDIFVMENLTFYKIKAVGTEPIGEGEIALNSELKIKKIITVGDSSDLKTKLDALSSEIETKLSRKENVIDKKSGFNLEKTNDFLNDENKVLTSKAGSILKTRIDDVNDRLNSINLTWDRIQNKPLVTSITSGNNNNIPSEGAIIRYVNGRVDSVNTTINSKIGEVNTKITALEGRPFTYDALLNKPVISDAIDSNLSNQIASSKAILDASNAIKEHIAGNFISNKITDTSVTTENKIQFSKAHYLLKSLADESLIEIYKDSEFSRGITNYFDFGSQMLWPNDFDKISSVHLKINSFDLNGIQVDNSLLFNNGEIFYKSSPILPKWTKIAMEKTSPEFKELFVNKVNSVSDFEVAREQITANKLFYAKKIFTVDKTSVLTEINRDASLVVNQAVIGGGLITTGNAEIRGAVSSYTLNTSGKITAGEIECRGNVKAYYASDIRLKSNIKKIDGALDKIDKISGYTFDMDGKREAGIIAQEIKEVLPEVVGEFEKDGETYLNVDYPKIIALLIEAIKELKNGR
jgi:distal tail fiber protein